MGPYIIIGIIIWLGIGFYRMKKGYVNNEHSIVSAARSGDLDRVKNAIDSGFDINFQSIGGITALEHACGKGFYDVVKYLIDNGADLNIQDKKGFTPLCAATLNKHKEIVLLLLESGADISLEIHDGKNIITIFSNSGEEGIDEIIEIIRQRSRM